MALLLLWLAVGPAVLALQVTPGSPCAAHCLDSPEDNDFRAADSTTNVTHVHCRDADYVTSDAGIKFRECLDCLQTSTAVAEGESDIQWYICEPRVRRQPRRRPTLTPRVPRQPALRRQRVPLLPPRRPPDHEPDGRLAMRRGRRLPASEGRPDE